MKRALITWMVVAVSVGWIALMPWDAARRQHALPDYGTVPAFSFIDQERHSIRREDFEGSVWVADFIFTRCAGQCPLMSSRMAALQRSLSALGHDSVRFVSFSVDPSYDTPERLAAYAAHYGADPRRWRFVTEAAGAPEARTARVTTIAELARQGFRVSASGGGSSVEPITHSARFAVIDPRGVIRGYYDAMEPQAMTRLVNDVRRLLGAPVFSGASEAARRSREAIPLPAATR